MMPTSRESVTVLTDKEVIATWKSIDGLSKRMIPSWLDRESIVSEVLIRLYDLETPPSNRLIRNRLIDVMRKESVFCRKTKMPRRAFSVSDEMFDSITHEDRNVSYDEKDLLDVVMGYEGWDGTEEKMIWWVFYQGKQVQEAGRECGLTVNQQKVLWGRVLRKLRFIGERLSKEGDRQ